jgi:xanthine dehydrogenase accessory factor
MSKFISETDEVVQAISEAHEHGTGMALATIVGVTGSTYRRPGARLLVTEGGQMVGNLSGGCLEGEVEGVAREVIESGDARLEYYDLTADDEVVWGWGLGCNGAIEVFIEPADKAAEVADAIHAAIEAERSLVSATVLESTVAGVERGARLVVGHDGAIQGSLGNPDVDGAAANTARTALNYGATEVRTLEAAGGSVRVFFETIEPPLRLLVCGAGHDAIPLVAAAASLGWRVTVVDDREGLLTRERFPRATNFVRARPGEVTAAAEVDERTHAVVMSHNYLRDRDYLTSLLTSTAAYIGMLGPKARLERLYIDLGEQGVEVGDADRERIHGPAGLDIGAEGPEEIAAAIVAEVLALSRDRSAGFLRDRDRPIHPRDAEARSA